MHNIFTAYTPIEHKILKIEVQTSSLSFDFFFNMLIFYDVMFITYSKESMNCPLTLK